MTVRAALPGDVPAIAALERLCFSEPWREQSLQEQISSPLAVTLVCRDEAGLLGYAYGSAIPPEGELYRIAVGLDARRGGIGTLLLTSFLTEMKARGATSVYLEVRESNSPARALYERNGFSLVGIRKNYYRAPLENAVIMLKKGL